MTDPVSIISIVAGSAGLVTQCLKVTRDLHDVVERYKDADLTINSMNTDLETVRWAWSRV